MRLTQFFDLAMRVLIYAAHNPNGRFTINDVNQVHNFSRGDLMKVVNTLTRSELLIAHRRQCGGIHLARSPENISLAEALALTEPDFALAEFMRDGDDCLFVGRCKLPNVYGNALQAFMQALKSQTLKVVLPAEPA